MPALCWPVPKGAAMSPIAYAYSLRGGWGHAAFGWRVSGLQAADEARTTLRRPSLVVPAEDGARRAIEGSVRLGVRHLPAVIDCAGTRRVERDQNPANPCGLLYGMLTLVISLSEPSG